MYPRACDIRLTLPDVDGSLYLPGLQSTFADSVKSITQAVIRERLLLCRQLRWHSEVLLRQSLLLSLPRRLAGQQPKEEEE